MFGDWLETEAYVNATGHLLNFPTNDSQWVGGKYNNALDYDGVDDTVHIDDIYIPTKAFTISLWINPDNNLDSASPREDFLYWHVQARPHLTFNKSGNGEIGMWPRLSSDFDDPQTTTASWTAGNWYHIAATFDSVAEISRIFRNGSEEHSVAHPSGDEHNAVYAAHLGSTTTNSNNFDGQIDDFRIYDYALLGAEVTDLYDGIDPAVGPLFWFKLDETSGDTAYESVGTIVYVPLPNPEADLVTDGFIGFDDFAMLAEHYLEYQPFGL